ncbi:arsenical-resistance protein ACR3 [Serendipita vermifera]|nr:arsenical-resistance protein ACR3 [Serendipita vermifera]
MSRIEDSPMFMDSCRNCKFCDGLNEKKSRKDDQTALGDENVGAKSSFKVLFQSLPFLDRYLAIFILAAMVLGILLGIYREEAVHRSFGGASWHGVSIPILIGLLVMMWPILTKVQYERLPAIFSTRSLWVHILLSLVLNWIIGPFVMLGLAWATLPEERLQHERQGVILVGIARCIAMVLIWSGLAQGDAEYCAILVCVNSVLQMVLFSPYALLMVNLLGGGGSTLKLDYSNVAISVGIYLGIPLAAGIFTRMVGKATLSKPAFQKFLKWFSPLSLLGLLYTIIVLFALQGNRIAHNLGSVFRIFVPLILYFTIMWSATVFGLQAVGKQKYGKILGGYDKIIVQAFTTASNNFELAIAVAISSFGPNSPEVLAATIGPLVEVPVLLVLSYVALVFRSRFRWTPQPISLG